MENYYYYDSELFVLELTAFHESNLMPSKTYKLNKYKNLSHHLNNKYKHYNIRLFTLEALFRIRTSFQQLYDFLSYQIT